MSQTNSKNGDSVKACCAEFYQQAAVKFFLGDSFHPGGLELTQKLAKKLGVSAASNVLDVACGEGTSAFFLAETVGCKVTGSDASEKAIAIAQKAPAHGGKVAFVKADSDRLPFPDHSFDFALTECAFSTFWKKPQVAAEIYRVLKTGGKWGLSDMLVEQTDLPETMKNLLFQVSCIAEALNLEGYAKQMRQAGFEVIETEDASWALESMFREVERKLSGAKILASASNLPVTKNDLNLVEELLTQGSELLKNKTIGYGIVVGKKC